MRRPPGPCGRPVCLRRRSRPADRRPAGPYGRPVCLRRRFSPSDRRPAGPCGRSVSHRRDWPVQPRTTRQATAAPHQCCESPACRPRLGRRRRARESGRSRRNQHLTARFIVQSGEDGGGKCARRTSESGQNAGEAQENFFFYFFTYLHFRKNLHFTYLLLQEDVYHLLQVHPRMPHVPGKGSRAQGHRAAGESAGAVGSLAHGGSGRTGAASPDQNGEKVCDGAYGLPDSVCNSDRYERPDGRDQCGSADGEVPRVLVSRTTHHRQRAKLQVEDNRTVMSSSEDGTPVHKAIPSAPIG